MSHANTAHSFVPYRRRSGDHSPAALFERVSLMLSVSRERRQLRALDMAALKDMGLDQADVTRESARPMWDLPAER